MQSFQLNYYYQNREKILAQRAEYYEKNKEAINNRSSEYFKSYYEKNKEKLIARNKERNKANPEACRLAQRKWVENHKQHTRLYAKNYHSSNRERCRENSKGSTKDGDHRLEKK